MALKYNYESMEKTTRELQALVNDFAVSYKNIANSVEWEGRGRDSFDNQVDSQLSAVVALLTEVSNMPQRSADKMRQADHDMAERVRRAFNL